MDSISIITAIQITDTPVEYVRIKHFIIYSFMWLADVSEFYIHGK